MAAAAANPMAALMPPPPVSKKTIHMAGILVDVYGLDEVPPHAARVSCLWLHHPRTRAKEDMSNIAARCVSAWNHQNGSSSGGGGGGAARGLIAAAFDQRNHGGRMVHAPGNAAWRDGNPTHAQDMFSIVAGTVADQVGLMDAVGGYVFNDEDGRDIDQHLALGVSLGGHSVWQLMFADPRVCAGVVVIGCPDYMGLISNRAKLSKLQTYSKADDGGSFIGSKDFPPALVEACRKSDPKAMFFGIEPVPSTPPTEAERQRLEAILDERVRGKRFLLCSGGDDKLVPYARSKAFVDWFRGAAETWFRQGDLRVDDRVYPGVGHAFSADMVRDAVQFVLDVVSGAESDQTVSKI